MINNHNDYANTGKDEFEELKERWRIERLKEKWEMIREEKMKTMVEIKTPLDDLLKIIKKYEEISLKDLHIILKIPMSLIEKWLLILEKKEMVELQYSLLGAVKVKINGKVRN